MPINRRHIPDYAANVCLAVTVVLLALIGILSYQTTQRFVRNDAKVAHAERVVESLQLVLSDLKDAETGQRGYLLTGNVHYLQPYTDGSQAVTTDLQALRTLLLDDPAQQKQLDSLQSLAQQKLTELSETVDLRQRSGLQAALPVVVTDRGKILMDGIRSIVGQMHAQEQRQLELRTKQAESAAKTAQIYTLFGFLVGVLLVCVASALVLRYIRERKQSEAKVLSHLGRLDLLHQITRAIGERQDLQSILQVLIRSLEDNLPIDFGCVCIYDQPGNVVQVIRVGVGSERLAMELAMPEQAKIPIDENGLSRCLKGQLVYEPDVSVVQFPFPQRLSRGGLRSLVVAPLLVESSVFGVLVSARKRVNSFSSGECEFLKQLSEHVGLAMHQAQLYGALQRAYEDLRQTQEAVLQQERLRALGQMASGIAHDINNAISPVALYTESMLETETSLSPRARDYLETIQRAIEDVAKTVARMREFYRQREPQLTLAAVDMNSVVGQVISLTRARWSDIPQQKGVVIDVQTDLHPNMPALMGAENEMREALTNLIFNAIDAMPDGGTLALRTRVAQHSAIVEVADTGIGMDESTRQRCLEPFFTTKGDRGTGLGLGMVYGVMQRHSAEIEIDSILGQGTTVRLIFPMPAVPSGEQPAEPRTYVKPPRMRILLVDDDPLLLKSLCDTLETDGHVVEVANGGEAGVKSFREALSTNPFAVVITDLGMPYVDGRKVAASVKEASRTTPVILLTGWGQRLVADNEIPPHVDRVLNKPPKLQELREALAAVISE